jgi:drug/metabolite transporter (DMT)-like permease
MSIAGIVAALWLIASGARRPSRTDLPLLAWAGLGIVIGFPLLTSIAMQTIPANHGAVINGALPFATAVLAAWAFGERHQRRFWICAAIGSLLVVAFALRDGLAARGTVALSAGDLAMIAAVLAGAVGYVAGGRVAGRIGGVATILWALVLALPLTLPATLLAVAQETPRAGLASWAAFAYVTLISQLVGFFAWYNGLALAGPGGMGRVGQVQLLQVFFTVGFAWLLFGEAVHPTTWLFALGVVATIALGRRPARED